jgi:LemA protein
VVLVVIVVVLVVLGVLLVVAVGGYNRLVSLRNKARDSWSGIDVQLTRRADLVPNLVQTVKGYAAHEQETLDAVVQARGRVVAASGPRESAAADGQLEGALSRLFALTEAYPDLKADAGFRQLQGELSRLEEDIASSRRYYNATVRDYDTARERFPTVVIANAAGFDREFAYYDAPSEDVATPEVDFG